MSGGPVGEYNVQLLDVIQGLAVDDGVGAAGVVADATAHAGAVGGGRIRSVLQPVGAHLAGELVQDDAGLDAGPLLFGVHLQDVVEVLAEVHDNGVVNGLAGEAGSAGSGQHGDAFAGGELDHGLYIGGGARDDHPHRLHLVNAGVGAVEQPGMRVETHLAVDAAAQLVSNLLAFAAANPALHYRRHLWSSLVCRAHAVYLLNRTRDSIGVVEIADIPRSSVRVGVGRSIARRYPFPCWGNSSR